MAETLSELREQVEKTAQQADDAKAKARRLEKRHARADARLAVLENAEMKKQIKNLINDINGTTTSTTQPGDNALPPKPVDVLSNDDIVRRLNEILNLK